MTALLRGVVAAAAPSPCNLPVAAGTCRAYIPSFYFDSTTGTCKSFAYTGCKGNANNFISIEDCQKTCRTKTAAAVTHPAPVKGLYRDNPFAKTVFILTIIVYIYQQM